MSIGTTGTSRQLADVAAKDGSQETLVNVLSLLFSLVLLPQVEGRPFTIWALFLLFTAVHLFANYRAVKCIQLETLNPNRLTLAVRHFVEYGSVPSVAECNRKEPILGTFAVRRNFGCTLAPLPPHIGPLVAKTNTSPQTAATDADRRLTRSPRLATLVATCRRRRLHRQRHFGPELASKSGLSNFLLEISFL
ncbi:hypothetical protein niasHT_025863 [Heterodera trifolii]|uniref:Protein root UVB sensitive/RUS domain-containing protein n=1 Tax=Heterodera trifolii TaxID=157864 RepID=A0ABD2KK10_9BILA